MTATLVPALAAFADACPSLAHHPGDDPPVLPRDITPDVGGSLRAVYVCPCGRTWPAWWVLTSPWPSRAPALPLSGTRAERMASFAELRRQKVTVDEAAARIGVTSRTATRYAASLRDGQAAA